MDSQHELNRTLRQLIFLVMALLLSVVGSTAFFLGQSLGLFPIRGQRSDERNDVIRVPEVKDAGLWKSPDPATIPDNAEGELIRYGQELIAHTSAYLGPEGSVRPISNGMNCQNCHLKAGTVPFGNNYGAVASKYPVFRNRSGTVEGFEKRVNDCIERSLNGQALDPASPEMQAIVSYLKWVGKDVKKGESPLGFGLKALPFLNRPADPARGREVYEAYCQRCHGDDGQGVMAEGGKEYLYPPLYGENSYNVGAGLYRISRFAAFVKYNMPYGITYENPFLSDEEAWDVAAYVNSMERPEKDLSTDWPDISLKPFDHPFGPYADTFDEQQHKFGPYAPIVNSISQ